MYIKEGFVGEEPLAPPELTLTPNDLRSMEKHDSMHPFRPGNVVMAKFGPIPSVEKKQEVDEGERLTVSKAWTPGNNGTKHMVMFVNRKGSYEACYFKSV